MSSEVVLYDPARAGLAVPARRRRRKGKAEVLPSAPRVMLPALRLSEEVREQVAAFLAAARERDPARAEFMDLMTASLGAVLIEQQLRVCKEMHDRLQF